MKPKHISILKMMIIHAFAMLVLFQLSQSIWMIRFSECLNAGYEATNAGVPENIFRDPSCIDEKTGENLLSLNATYFVYTFPSLIAINIILSIISLLKLGFKWYWFMGPFIMEVIISRTINIFFFKTESILHKIILSVFDNFYIAVYGNIILALIISLFLYFGKPVHNLIKNDTPKPSNKDLEDILDIE